MKYINFWVVRKNEPSQFYHTFTGCDTTSQFYGKGKKNAWESWKSYPEVTKAFLSAIIQPFALFCITSELMKLLERYTCVLYDKLTLSTSVDELRQELFCKKGKLMENIPPTQVGGYQC